MNSKKSQARFKSNMKNINKVNRTSALCECPPTRVNDCCKCILEAGLTHIATAQNYKDDNPQKLKQRVSLKRNLDSKAVVCRCSNNTSKYIVDKEVLSHNDNNIKANKSIHNSASNNRKNRRKTAHKINVQKPYEEKNKKRREFDTSSVLKWYQGIMSTKPEDNTNRAKIISKGAHCICSNSTNIKRKQKQTSTLPSNVNEIKEPQNYMQMMSDKLIKQASNINKVTNLREMTENNFKSQKVAYSNAASASLKNRLNGSLSSKVSQCLSNIDNIICTGRKRRSRNYDTSCMSKWCRRVLCTQSENITNGVHLELAAKPKMCKCEEYLAKSLKNRDKKDIRCSCKLNEHKAHGDISNTISPKTHAVGNNTKPKRSEYFNNRSEPNSSITNMMFNKKEMPYDQINTEKRDNNRDISIRLRDLCDSDISILRLKKIIQYNIQETKKLCYKYCSKLLGRNDICEDGICNDFDKHFTCMCSKSKSNTCDEISCAKARQLNYEKNKPMFEMIVDGLNMDVINSTETKKKIKKHKKDKKLSCNCPSHGELVDKYKNTNETSCKDGPCEIAMQNKGQKFTCKCHHQHKDISNICNETTCETPQKPSFVIKMDQNKMKIMNADEIREILSKKKDLELNIEEVEQKSKKYTHFTNISKKFVGDNKVQNKNKHVSYIDQVEKKNKNFQNSTNVPKKVVDRSELQNRKDFKQKVNEADQRSKKMTQPNNVQKTVGKGEVHNTKRIHKKKKNNRDELDVLMKGIGGWMKQQTFGQQMSDKKLQKQINKDMQISEILRQKELKKQLKIAKLESSATEHNCFVEFLIGIFHIGIGILKTCIFILFKIVTQPRSSYMFVKMRFGDPLGTYNLIKEWLAGAWRLKRIQMTKSLERSPTMTILLDTVKETALGQALTPKGTTKKERRKNEKEAEQRKLRIRRREKLVMNNCNHVLLATLRKTPCLWVYYICPVFYPHCLSFLAFIRNFSNLMLFLLALLVWTPCIIASEMCRAVLCCTLCTQ